jgi:tRNA G10  N-methylase Trm11
MHKILAPGGIWINLGPLLWHWENNNTNDTSVELDLEELKTLARRVGFEISVSTASLFQSACVITMGVSERSDDRYDICEQSEGNAGICVSRCVLDGDQGDLSKKHVTQI